MTLNSYALLQQTSDNLSQSIHMLKQELKNTTMQLDAIKSFYPENSTPSDNDSLAETSAWDSSKLASLSTMMRSPQLGMQIEFRLVFPSGLASYCLLTGIQERLLHLSWYYEESSQQRLFRHQAWPACSDSRCEWEWKIHNHESDQPVVRS